MPPLLDERERQSCFQAEREQRSELFLQMPLLCIIVAAVLWPYHVLRHLAFASALAILFARLLAWRHARAQAAFAREDGAEQNSAKSSH